MSLNIYSAVIQSLARRHSNVKYMHAYPGIVKTPLSQNLPWYARAGMAPIMLSMGIPAEQCAEHLVYALLQSDLGSYTTGGASFVDNKGDPITKKAIATEEECRQVMQHTAQVLG